MPRPKKQPPAPTPPPTPTPPQRGHRKTQAHYFPAEVDLAVRLVEVDGLSPADAIQHPGVGGKLALRTLYNELERRKAAAPPSPAAPATPPEAPPAPVVAERPPEGLSPRALRRWHIERQIEAVRQALALTEGQIAKGNTTALSRVGSLNDQLRKWLDALAELEGPERADPDAEARVWRQHAESAIEKIKAGCADARERMGALLGRPFPYAADVGAGGPAARVP